MDIDALSAARQRRWQRLDELVGRRRVRPGEVDELVTLYRATAEDLSRVRSQAPDPQLLAVLSHRVAMARGRVSAGYRTSWQVLRDGAARSVPAALYAVRWWTVGAMVLFVGVAVLAAVWTLRSPQAMASIGSARELDEYAQRAFASYYSNQPAADFGAAVWTNNARLAVLCVAGGITGVVPVGLLLVNAVSVGQAAAVMADHGMLDVFVTLIIPHGLAELTCVFIAAGAGTRLLWCLLVPGPRSRSQALAREGRRVVLVAVALVVALGACGLIEAFVTPSPVPWPVKAVVGLLAVAVLWAYTLVLGRRAVASGYDGDLPAWQAGSSVPEAG